MRHWFHNENHYTKKFWLTTLKHNSVQHVKRCIWGISIVLTSNSHFPSSGDTMKSLVTFPSWQERTCRGQVDPLVFTNNHHMVEALDRSGAHLHIRMINSRPKDVNIDNNAFIHSIVIEVSTQGYNGEEIKHGPHCRGAYFLVQEIDNRKTW